MTNLENGVAGEEAYIIYIHFFLLRTTRTRSYGGENESNRSSPRPERRNLRHSLDSNEAITSTRPDRRRLRHSLDLTQTKGMSILGTFLS